jgi:hypothetical protein
MRGYKKMSEYIDLDLEAERRGKVSWLTFRQAKRLGIDPDSLLKQQQEREAKIDRELAEYREYVLGSGKPSKRKA